VSRPQLVVPVCVAQNVLIGIVVPARAGPSFVERALQECLLGESLRKLCDVLDWYRRNARLVQSPNGSERLSITLDTESRIFEGGVGKRSEYVSKESYTSPSSPASRAEYDEYSPETSSKEV
jgi:hypothetical protein